MSEKTTILELQNVHASYGKIEVLHDISIHVHSGEIVTILGANGAGKTTTLLTISGLIKLNSGSILFEGQPIHNKESHRIVSLGIAQSPEGRRVFGTMTVMENLNLGGFCRKNTREKAQTKEWILEIFPRLKERAKQLAGTLSGGEQQMLAIGRALMAKPKVLLLDEPSLGLAPILIQSIFSTIKSISSSGLTIILVEQNAKAALKLADKGYVMEAGKIVLAGEAKDLLTNPEVQKAYFGHA